MERANSQIFVHSRFEQDEFEVQVLRKIPIIHDNKNKCLKMRGFKLNVGAFFPWLQWQMVTDNHDW